MKRKILGIILVLTMSCMLLAACSSSSDDSYSSDSSYSSFTNKYGTPTTKCVQSGCNEYIASSGDTNCCVAHSNNCRKCGDYIDGDAMFCMSCLEDAFGK